MTDAKLYVDRVAVASAFDSISSIDAIIFGREAGGVVNERRPGGAIGSAKHAASKSAVAPVSLDSMEHTDQLVFEQARGGAPGDSARPKLPEGTQAHATLPRADKTRAFATHKLAKPDPFAAQSARLLSALETHPAHLANERWPVVRVAKEFAFRLEQIGSSLENCTRNLGRLCVALKIGTVEDNKVVAVSALDAQRIAASWGLVIDRAQMRELFALHKCAADVPVPISLFVRRFSEPIGVEGGILDSSRPRSYTRPPPIDYGGGSGPYSGGRANEVEQARVASYKAVGDRRRTEFQAAWSNHVAKHAAKGTHPSMPGAVSNVARLHERMQQSGMTHTDAIRKVVRTVGHGTLAANSTAFGVSALRLSPELLVRTAAALGVTLHPPDVATLMGAYGECSVSEFASRFLDSDPLAG